MTDGILPVGGLIPQDEVQSRLYKLQQDGATLPEILHALRIWKESIGYFDHLSGSNLHLEFPSSELDVDVRLQVNYSRVGYTPPTGTRPACPLCLENIGTAGKEKLRVHHLELNGRPYFAHLTPFPLHPGHFVVNKREHLPMELNREAFEEAITFTVNCPGWLLASNSDLMWAGASVLQHHHFQTFPKLRLPIEDAAEEGRTSINRTTVSTLRWPCPSLRLYGGTNEVVETAFHLLQEWKSPESARRTCNFLASSTTAGTTTLHMILRHSEHRTQRDLQPIKSEGVGIIEMAGEIILPPRMEMTAAENRDYFHSIGDNLIPRLISQNSPPMGIATEFFNTIGIT